MRLSVFVEIQTIDYKLVDLLSLKNLYKQLFTVLSRILSTLDNSKIGREFEHSEAATQRCS